MDPQQGLVRVMTADDLSCVLAWRNHPSIRDFMLTQHEISMAEHAAWYERCSRDPNRRLLIFEAGANPLGFVHFTRAGRGDTADWGFYAAPDAPKGTGKRLGRAALNFAFRSLELHKVCGQALDLNRASIGFHLMLGFRQEGVLREQCRLGMKYHDLVCFGLLRCEWLEREVIGGAS